MKTKQAPLMCPVCKEAMHVTQLQCHGCDTEIKGHFHVSKFNYLNPETQYFIELFLKNRGNIKAVEKEMNVSYPTVKKWLDDAISKLGYKLDEDDDVEPDEENETDPLSDLKAGIIDVKEALAKIKQKHRK